MPLSEWKWVFLVIIYGCKFEIKSLISNFYIERDQKHASY